MSRKKKLRIMLEVLLILVVCPCTLIIFWRSNRRYYLCSLLIFIYILIPFLLSFEHRRPQVRELVTLSVLSAIAVVSRAAFMMFPHFKPMTGMIMISGMAFGGEAGFLIGAVSAFVSNFIFGQGPWTPWQMFSYGIAGLLAGLLASHGWMSAQHRLRTAVTGFLIVLCIEGPLLDTSTFFTIAPGLSHASASAVYLSGLPVNVIHGIATFLTLLLFSSPMLEKLERIKTKYGMMEGTASDEI